MLIGQGIAYRSVPFTDEAEIERVVQENAELLFGTMHSYFRRLELRHSVVGTQYPTPS